MYSDFSYYIFNLKVNDTGILASVVPLMTLWPVAYLRHVADVILLLGLEVDVAGVQLRHTHHGAQQSGLAAATRPQQSVAATTE